MPYIKPCVDSFDSGTGYSSSLPLTQNMGAGSIKINGILDCDTDGF
jgi:hypothetical protein